MRLTQVVRALFKRPMAAPASSSAVPAALEAPVEYTLAWAVDFNAALLQATQRGSQEHLRALLSAPFLKSFLTAARALLQAEPTLLEVRADAASKSPWAWAGVGRRVHARVRCSRGPTRRSRRRRAPLWWSWATRTASSTTSCTCALPRALLRAALRREAPVH